MHTLHLFRADVTAAGLGAQSMRTPARRRCSYSSSISNRKLGPEELVLNAAGVDFTLELKVVIDFMIRGCHALLIDAQIDIGETRH
jgi:hypothetical protein